MHFLRAGFAFPRKLNDILIEQLWNGHVPAAADLRKRASALAKLWPTLAKERGQVKDTRHYSLDASFAEAYAAYYLPANLMKMAMVLEEMRAFGIGLEGSVKWLDVGSGPGTAFWGAQWWASHRGVELDFLNLEQSKEFIRVGERLSRELARARWEQFTHAKGGGKSLDQWLRQERPQVVSMMNSVGEMAHDAAARAAWIGEVVDELSTYPQDDGKPRWLILIEPGAKNATRELLQLRESFRQREDVRVWLPCLSARPCGALERADDWCHEEAEVRFPDWMNALGAEAGMRKEAVLFSYLVVSIGRHPDEPASWPGRGLRIVSQMMREKGLTQCFLCSENGKLRSRVLNSRTTPENERFLASGRGTVYSSVELSEKGDVVSMIDVEAAAEADPTVFPPLR